MSQLFKPQMVLYTVLHHLVIPILVVQSTQLTPLQVLKILFTPSQVDLTEALPMVL